MADNSDNGVWIFVFFLALIGGFGWLMWHFFQPQINWTVIHTRAVQMNVASIWTPEDKIIQVPMPYEVRENRGLDSRNISNDKGIQILNARFGDWRRFANTVTVANVQNDHLRVMTFVAMRVWRVPFAILMGMFFVWVIFNGPTSKFRRVLGLEALIRDQAKSFRVVRPFLDFNPNTLPVRAPGSDVPADLPEFAEALGPEEWIAYNEIPMPDGNLDREATEEAMAKQLGERWDGPFKLKPHEQILLAVFCLKTSRHREEADLMLGRLASCWSHKGGLKLGRESGLLSSARKVLRNKDISEKTLSNCNRHAYVTTALMRALDTARSEGGVLAPAEFVWLRAFDRALWYPLNNLGRTAFHMEALGACSHYRAEKQVNRPISKPRMGDGFEGILEHLKNPLFARPIPEVDYSKSKKRKPGKTAGVMKPKAA